MSLQKKAIVIDRIKKEINFKQTTVLQVLGISNFSLLEIVTDENKNIMDDISTEDKKVKRISYNKLSSTAKQELERAIEKVIDENKEKFVNFFNNAKPIGTRRHQLDLLPMVGKKHRMAILKHLQTKGKFKTFEEIRQIDMMPEPKKIIVQRVIDEIIDGDEIKYNLFTMPHFKK